MPAVDNIFMTGKIASIQISRTDGEGVLDVPIPAISSTISVKMDTPDASNYGGKGYVGLVPGIMDAEITVDIAYDKLAMPVIFAGMKADVTFDPDGNRQPFLNTSPTSTEATLDSNEYKEYNATPATFQFTNCTVTNVTYEVPVRDIQKAKITLIPSATSSVNWNTVQF